MTLTSLWTRRSSTQAAKITGALAGTLLLAGCGAQNSAAGDASASASEARVTVVASTNVWGDVAESVGGEAVEVTSIISDPSQDPHSFEASSTTLLTLSKADLVVQNGGGYDDFMQRMTDSSGSEATVLTAVDLAGSTALDSEDANEHVWYDLASVERMTDAIARELARAYPDGAQHFSARAADLKRDLAGLRKQVAEVHTRVAGSRIGITEPVPLLLTEACGLLDATPPDFSEAVEEGDDVSPAVLKETLDLYADRSVSALVLNEQTSGPITEKVEAAAREAGVPVVAVTETLPAGLGYVEWMGDTLSRLRAALEGQ
ncbi:MAG TPA: zinc ABC transporter substrate-binding protein [Nocardioidaceae bacterium]|nr:zinc ABC transporter substrate-binding protein [Nocardioidaceae bacterium]